MQRGSIIILGLFESESNGSPVVWVSKYDPVATLVEIIINEQIAIICVQLM